jgi:hypothetical protein
LNSLRIKIVVNCGKSPKETAVKSEEGGEERQWQRGSATKWLAFNSTYSSHGYSPQWFTKNNTNNNDMKNKNKKKVHIK